MISYRTILLLGILIIISYIYSVMNFTKIKSVCGKYNIKCEVVVVDAKIVNAYVAHNYPGKIFVTTALLNKLSSDEVNSVLLHEIGHLVLNHTDPTQYKGMSKEQFCSVRRQQETQADIFATLEAKRSGMESNLDEALLKIAPPDKYNIPSCTHPSPNDRIATIRRIE